MFSLRSALACSVLLAAGCGAHRQSEYDPLTLVRELVGQCKAGDAEACDEALTYSLGYAELMPAELRGCEAGEVDHCVRAARWLDTGYRSTKMLAALDRGCALGSTWSCARLVDVLFERHLWIWECAAGQRPELVATTKLLVTLHGAGRLHPMQLELAPLPPEGAELRSCLVDALDHSILPAVRLVGVQQFEVTLNLEPPSFDFQFYFADKYGAIELSVSEEGDPSLASCPRGAPSPCRIVPKEAFSRIYSPHPPITDLLPLRRPDTPKQPALVIEYCIDPSGRYQYIHTLDDDGAPKIAAAFVETMSKWRSKPALMDGEPIFACTRAVFTLEFVWWGAWTPWPHS